MPGTHTGYICAVVPFTTLRFVLPGFCGLHPDALLPVATVVTSALPVYGSHVYAVYTFCAPCTLRFIAFHIPVGYLCPIAPFAVWLLPVALRVYVCRFLLVPRFARLLDYLLVGYPVRCLRFPAVTVCHTQFTVLPAHAVTLYAFPHIPLPLHYTPSHFTLRCVACGSTVGVAAAHAHAYTRLGSGLRCRIHYGYYGLRCWLPSWVYIPVRCTVAHTVAGYGLPHSTTAYAHTRLPVYPLRACTFTFVRSAHSLPVGYATCYPFTPSTHYVYRFYTLRLHELCVYGYRSLRFTVYTVYAHGSFALVAVLFCHTLLHYAFGSLWRWIAVTYTRVTRLVDFPIPPLRFCRTVAGSRITVLRLDSQLFTTYHIHTATFIYHTAPHTPACRWVLFTFGSRFTHLRYHILLPVKFFFLDYRTFGLLQLFLVLAGLRYVVPHYLPPYLTSYTWFTTLPGSILRLPGSALPTTLRYAFAVLHCLSCRSVAVFSYCTRFLYATHTRLRFVILYSLRMVCTHAYTPLWFCATFACTTHRLPTPAYGALPTTCPLTITVPHRVLHYGCTVLRFFTVHRYHTRTHVVRYLYCLTQFTACRHSRSPYAAIHTVTGCTFLLRIYTPHFGFFGRYALHGSHIYRYVCSLPRTMPHHCMLPLRLRSRTRTVGPHCYRIRTPRTFAVARADRAFVRFVTRATSRCHTPATLQFPVVTVYGCRSHTTTRSRTVAARVNIWLRATRTAHTHTAATCHARLPHTRLHTYAHTFAPPVPAVLTVTSLPSYGSLLVVGLYTYGYAFFG